MSMSFSTKLCKTVEILSTHSSHKRIEMKDFLGFRQQMHSFPEAAFIEEKSENFKGMVGIYFLHAKQRNKRLIGKSWRTN